MPIIYVHGVSIREDSYWPPLESLLRQTVAPIISADPKHVKIVHCYWGDLGARLRWSGASRPETPLDKFAKQALAPIEWQPNHIAPKARRMLGKLKNNSREKFVAAASVLKDRSKFQGLQIKRLSEMTREKLSELAFHSIAQNTDISEQEQAALVEAVDEVAHDETFLQKLAKCKSVDDEMQLFDDLVKARYEQLEDKYGLARLKQTKIWNHTFTKSLTEGLARSVDSPGFMLTRAAVEIRKSLNEFVATFLGDVMIYLRHRGTHEKPGPIPRRLLETLLDARKNQLERNDEPLIVLSHSMGGQLMYDALTHFIPKCEKYEDIRVDFWCATASQVGFFEELKLFLESDDLYSEETAKAVPYPSKRHLGFWWNVWDHNDFVSYSAKSIIDGVDDSAYNSGMFLVNAHGGYLVRPSFFRELAKRVKKAQLANWLRDELSNQERVPNI